VTRARAPSSNSYGIGRQPRLPELEPALARSAAARTRWSASPRPISSPTCGRRTTWCARGMRASFVSHDDFPDEDVVLPDVVRGGHQLRGNTGACTSRATTSRSRIPPARGPGEPQSRDHRLRARNQAHLVQRSFTLVEASRDRRACHARGFYRLEYFDPERFAWWWPIACAGPPRAASSC
jgi:hypothetical protein